jgi:hypothetical protein
MCAQAGGAGESGCAAGGAGEGSDDCGGESTWWRRKLSAESAAAAAKKLAKVAERQINELAMNARFEVVVTGEEEVEAWTAFGWDRVECRIATNPGSR